MADDVTPKNEAPLDDSAPTGEHTQLTSTDALDESERTQQIDSAALLAIQDEQEEDQKTAEHPRPDFEAK